MSASSTDRPMATYLHKIITTLKETRHPMTLMDIEYEIQARIDNDEELINRLKNHSNLHYDESTKRFSFWTPYMPYVKSKETLLSYLQKRPEGLKIEENLTDTHQHIERWVNDVIREQKVRAIRTKVFGGKKCLRPDPNGNPCDIYSDRCDKCIDNKDVVIFPKSLPEIEDIFVSEDIQELWQNIPEMRAEDLEQHFDVQPARLNKSIHEAIERAQKLKKGRGGNGSRSRNNSRAPRLVNTHVLSASDMAKAGMNFQTGSTPIR